MFYYQSNFWEDLFFPRRNDNLKKVIVLSAVTGLASAAIANFFSKRENRASTRRAVDRIADELYVIKNRINDKAHDMADEFNSNVRRKARQIPDKVPDVEVKYDKTNQE
jgi:hypothetical protein